MNNQANIPGIGTPMVDKDGRVSQVWWPFLVSLFNRTGAGTGIPPTSADGQDAAALAASMVPALSQSHRSASDAAMLLMQMPPSNAALMVRVAALEAIVATLLNASNSPARRLSDLDAEINSMVTPQSGVTGTVIVKG